MHRNKYNYQTLYLNDITQQSENTICNIKNIVNYPFICKLFDLTLLKDSCRFPGFFYYLWRKTETEIQLLML